MSDERQRLATLWKRLGREFDDVTQVRLEREIQEIEAGLLDQIEQKAPAPGTGDEATRAARRLVDEVDLQHRTHPDDHDDSLLSFEADVVTVARAVLAGDRAAEVAALRAHGERIAELYANAVQASDAQEAEIERLRAGLDDHRAYSAELLQAAWIYRVAFGGYRSPADGEMLERARKRLFAAIDPKREPQAEQIQALAGHEGAEAP